jgi:hypothetical protein
MAKAMSWSISPSRHFWMQVATAAIVGEAEACVLGLFEDVLVFGHVYGDAALLEGYLV